MKINWKSHHILLLGSIVFAAIMVVQSTQRTLTATEGALFQIVSLALGILWSYEQANRKDQPHAKSAFRRIVALYKSLARVRTHIQNAPSHYQLDEEGKQALHFLDSIVVEQLSTAEDSIEDWKELLSESEIKAIVANSAASPNGKENGKD
ncbi:MAG: hypothetical protein JST40_05465 [Armatimonadetes bacterium]|nr:hypothetical protein [Armatimonadota bacterium]